MKKTLLLLVAFLLLGGLAYYFLKNRGGQPASSSGVSWDMDFAVENTDEIQKIFIADRKGKTVLLERKDGYWQYNGKWKARDNAVKNLLDVIKRVRVAYLSPKVATQKMVETVATQGIKVEIYTNSDKPHKTYYVGGVTGDETGTFFMMENAEQPYVVHIPSFVGQMRTRFFVEEEEWRDRAVFYESPETVQSISVEYPANKSESFILEKTDKATYQVKPMFATTAPSTKPFNNNLAASYIIQYEELQAEDFSNRTPTRDSIAKTTTPFAIVNLEKTDGSRKKVRFFPVEVNKNSQTGEVTVHRYFADCDWGDFMLVQDRVFGRIFRGYGYFFDKNPPKKTLNQ